MILINNDDLMGKNIRYLRRKQNLPQEALARLADMDQGSLDAIEKGILLEIDAEVLQKICEYFRVDIQTLVEDSLESKDF